VPINPDRRAKELEYLMGDSEMVAALAIPARACVDTRAMKKRVVA
jgi:hypothetical protein